MPPKPDLVFHNAPNDVETVHTTFKFELNPTKPDNDLSHTHRPSATIIEDWASDSEDESEAKIPQNAPSFVQPTEQVKSPRPSVQHVETSIPTANPKIAIPKPTSNGNRKNRKACFQYAQMTLPNLQRHMVPTTVITKSKIVPISAARLVTTVVLKSHVTRPRPAKPIVTKPHSPPRRHINRSPSPKASNFPLKVTAVKVLQVNAAKGVQGKWEWKPKCLILDHVSRNTSASMTLKRFDYSDALGRSKSDKGVIDSGCLRHMIGNMSYLSDFKELNGGYVAFGGNPKGGKISGKGKIRTGNLDFNDVYFVKELKFNLFSVSQMCDKKNSILFTDTECLVLSPEVKLPDENQVLLRVPRGNNMYNVNLKHIVTSGDLTCLFAKVTLDASNLWHRRLGHINFKIMNKLVKGNLVRVLPTKVFENDHTCVACKKGKQHRASCKTKPVSLVNQPLQRLHMDLFGPTFVKSLNKKSYCLVVTDDYSRFTGIENQLSLKAKGKSHVESLTGYRNLSVEFEDFYDNSINEDNAAALEDINYSDDEDDVGVEADFNNLEKSIIVIPILKTRVHKDHHEEGINYEEFFALVARIEAIRLSFMGFMVYQMDVKNALFYGTIEEEVYVCQPLGFEEPNYPDKVYKVVKALYGLHQDPRACTPIDTKKPLLKDPDGEDVNVHTYRSMIGSLMYLTSSRSDIMFVVYACAHFQMTPNALHLHEVKRIFRYLKGKPHLGLWYLKDSPFDLVAYSDSDYASASLDRKSTTRGCNHSNPSAGVQEQFDPEKAGEENVQQYVHFPVWSSGSTNPHNTDGDAVFNENKLEFEGRKPKFEVNVSPSSSAQSKKHDDKTKREAKGKSPVEPSTGYRNLSTEFEDFFDNSINEDNTAGKSSYVDSSQLPDDPNMPELEDITYSDDEYNVGAEADFNNLETSITVSPIPTTSVHKDHPVTQIIATQARSMSRVAQDQGGLSQINNDDFHTCMFACFLSQKEPKRVHQALKDPSWIEAMQEEPLQFKMQKVWGLVDLPHEKRAIGHTQEGGIDYEEVFAPVARIEAIRLFLAYASFMGFMVYQIDVQSTFLYGTIEEEIYVDDIIFGSTNKDLCKAFEKLMKDKFELSSMGELTFFLGLQVKQKKDRIFISQDKYVAEILRKFGLPDGKSASTPIDTEKPLLKDPDVPDQMVLGKDSSNPLMADNLPKIVWYSTHHVALMKSWLAPKQTALGQTATGKEISNLFMAGGLPKTMLLTFIHLICIDMSPFEFSFVYLVVTKGIDCLPNEEIFKEFVRMGYEKPSTKLTFFKAFFLSQWKFLIHTILQCMSAKRTLWNEFSSFMASDVICLSTGGIGDGIESSLTTTRTSSSAALAAPSVATPTVETSSTFTLAILSSTCCATIIPSKSVIAASATIIATAPQLTIVAALTLTTAPSAVRRRKGVVIRDPEETATPSTIIHTEAQSKNKRKGILVEEPKPLKKQDQIEHDEAYARELEAELNKNID
uniref:Putative ribonuclease H-like domain-containing protein n=1 Tax=Tanacetum cinerariifolium TaxID=118510 RepID=A0A6L2LQS3_TANCI|nr:putative ribonuclease H-like domain-containing protein [Tanacetum cinerariifolium]